MKNSSDITVLYEDTNAFLVHHRKRAEKRVWVKKEKSVMSTHTYT